MERHGSALFGTAAVMTPKDDQSTVQMLLQMVQQNDDKHEEAHHRLRLDHRALVLDVQTLQTRMMNLALQSDATARAIGQIPASTLTLTTSQVVIVVGFCCSLVAGAAGVMWQMNFFRTEQAMQGVKIQGIERAIANIQGRLDK